MRGESTAPANFGVGSWIERRARIAPDHVALIQGDRSLTYAELARRVRRLANGLRRLGVTRGDRVAWLGANHSAFLESLFASGLLGAALAPVNHRLEADEISSILQSIEPTVLIQHSEAAPLVLIVDPESAPGRIGPAGRPALLVDVRIVSPDGTGVQPGETGELLVRGPNVMAGYWKHPEATREVLTSDGWLRTGDAARGDDEGSIWIVGRVADRFLSEGQPVDPGDVERVLTGHPSIADAGVVQVIADGGNEVIVAFVVLSAGSEATEDEVLAFGRKHLDPHQVPAAVTFVDRLPRNSVGKLIRTGFRAHLLGPA